MTARAVALVSIIVGAAPILAALPAQAQGCEELWYRRNSLYKQAGYCFKTAGAPLNAASSSIQSYTAVTGLRWSVNASAIGV